MSISKLMLLIALLSLTGCGGELDDLSPSGENMTVPVVPGSSGVQVSQQAIDFVLNDTLNVPLTLSAEYPAADALVLYFTMWCPVCDSHMGYMRQYIRPNFPNVSFYMIDYVSGSVTASRQAQLSNGYTDFSVMVDEYQQIQDLYNATMGTTIVIDSTGIVRMNEDFKDGVKLYETLSLLP
ncbi:MAG: peroxiredoxin family protein [Gammaproteobacteria bacterium]|nr:peroxiredoxin family protein [Gammaproteobacteria bacterium]